MKKLKKAARLFCLTLFLILALTGIAITGAAPPPPKNREGIIDNETLIEIVDKKKATDEEKP